MTEKAFRPDVDAPAWKGGHSPYDIIKEGTIALVVVALLTLLLSIVFGSPDEHAITIKTWSNANPVDFATTAVNELNGTTTTAQYGAPYGNPYAGAGFYPPRKPRSAWFWPVIILGAVLVLGLLFCFPFSKLRHLFFAPTNLFFRNLKPRGRLAPIYAGGRQIEVERPEIKAEGFRRLRWGKKGGESERNSADARADRRHG